MKSLILITVALTSISAFAAKDLKKDFDSLGDNPKVVERVRNLDTDQKVRVVQNRLVSRNNRIELGVNYGALSGGDSYVKTSNLGAALQYHINSRWSLGVSYEKSYNSLNAEGQRQYDVAYAAQQKDPASPQRFAAVDFPLDTKMATVSFYPIYGKMNIFDSSIAQFDIYTTLGYGKKQMYSGESDVFSGAVGAGIWLTSRITARLEARYEKYTDLVQSEKRDQNAFSALGSLGVLVW